MADTLWPALMGPDHAAHAGSCALLCQIARTIPPEALTEALARLDRAETVGVILDPSAWLDGTRQDNARQLRPVLVAMRGLCEAVGEVERG